jgi:hypothetical protein
MNYSINVNTIRAAHFCAASKDHRQAINGVLLDFKSDHVNIVATDGHLLAAYRDEYINTGEDFSLIIPIDVVKLMLKMVVKGQECIELEELDDNWWQLGDIKFTLIDGKFPDYQRVIPRNNSRSTSDGAHPRFNPNQLLRAQKSINIRMGYKPSSPSAGFMAYGVNPNDSAVLHDGTGNSVVVIMPMRVAEKNLHGL